ncbi:MAG: hypothetical protein F4Y16_03100 [Holophagales bacterium]|nr:outer membrane beta-barrel protein [Acidobacteriota bacterium]MYB17971.1 hypothetical protein [Holophagales bacterium]MYH24928.1 hypothetical protein [Holophagales bacterium]
MLRAVLALALSLAPLGLHAQEEQPEPEPDSTWTIWLGTSSASFDGLSFGGVNTVGYATFSGKSKFFLSTSLAQDEANVSSLLGYDHYGFPLYYNADIRATRSSVAVGFANRPESKTRAAAFLSANYTAFSTSGTVFGESFSESDNSFDLGFGAAVAIRKRLVAIVQWGQASFDDASGDVLTFGLGWGF